MRAPPLKAVPSPLARPRLCLVTTELGRTKDLVSNRAGAFVLEPEIARGHALVARDVLCRTAQDEFAELHDISAVGYFQRGLRVLFDEQYRYAVGAQLADGAENIGHDDRREPKARLVPHPQKRRAHQHAAPRQHLLLAAAHRA